MRIFEAHKIPPQESAREAEKSGFSREFLKNLFYWNTLDEYSDLKRLELIFTSLPAGGLLDALCRMRSGGGRNDWPPESMLKACIARIVYQPPSMESFRRELQRNSSLMPACGFKLMACGNDRQRYRVPSKSAYSRFNRQRYSRQGRDLGHASPLGQARVSLHRSERPTAEESNILDWL